LEVAAKMLAQEPRSLRGQQIGSYKILSLLGAGGMGIVYQARDAIERASRVVESSMLRHLDKNRAGPNPKRHQAADGAGTEAEQLLFQSGRK
jgi:serine/threonine protein kinase